MQSDTIYHLILCLFAISFFNTSLLHSQTEPPETYGYIDIFSDIDVDVTVSYTSEWESSNNSYSIPANRPVAIKLFKNRATLIINPSDGGYDGYSKEIKLTEKDDRSILIIDIAARRKRASDFNINNYDWVVEPKYTGLGVVDPSEYDHLCNPSNLFVVQREDNKKWGVINENGENLIPYKYYSLGRIGNFFFAKREGYSDPLEMLDEKGSVVLPFKFKTIERVYCTDLFIAREGPFSGQLQYLVNLREDRIVDTTSGNGWHFDEEENIGYTPYSDDTKYINKEGKVLFSQGPYSPNGRQLISYYPFSDDKVVMVWNHSKNGAWQKNTVEIRNSDFAVLGSLNYKNYDANAYGFSEGWGNWFTRFRYGLMAVKRNNKWGFVNERGEEVIQCQFDEVTEFMNNICYVYLGNKIGVIDREGKYVIYPTEDIESIDNFVKDYFNEESNLLMIGRKNSSTNLFLLGVIDQKGNTVIPYEFHSMYFLNDPSLLIGYKRGIGYNLYSSSGRKLTRINYSGISNHISEGLISVYRKVEENGKMKPKWGFINRNGEEVIPCEFNSTSKFINGVTYVSHGKYIKVIREDGSSIISIPLERWDTKENLKNERSIPDNNSTSSILWVKVDGKWGMMKNPNY